MRSARKAWVVAASIGVVEALKDQGVCRWNYTIRSVHQYAKINIRSICQTRKLSSSSAIVSRKKMKPEESLRTIMYLSCWGPN